MFERALLTCTPCCVTACGSRDSTRLMRFCTSTAAISGFVPGTKVTVIVTPPVALLSDSTYCRPSAPFISCSMTLVTASSSTCAVAPG
jgi:hypothetical protein